jgi:flagellar hook-length control protein FliK
VEHVARTIIERVDNGGGDARIHLDPAGLGEVTIHVHTQGEHVHVEVRAEQREAAQLLRDHTQDLSTLLGERGLTLADVNVGLGRGGGDQTWARDEAPRSRPNSGEFAAIFGAGDTTSLETHNRLRAAYNPDGAHMYRV